MKKVLLLVAVVAGMMISTVKASTADLFSVDQVSIEQEFAGLNDLDAFVSNSNVELGDLSAAEMNSISNLSMENFNANSPLSPAFTLADMDWASFAWGFCCWPIGLFVVVLNKNKSSEQKISFLIGAIVTTVLGAIGGGGAA